MNKTRIRSLLLQRRKNLSQKQITALSKNTVNHIRQSTLYQQAHRVALYLPFNGEVDISDLLKTGNKIHYLPSIQGEQMQFHRYTPELQLIHHRFGIQQPEFIASLPAAELDLCLLPLVGFDLQGNRLGMGGGFYDRYFADHNTRQHTQLAGVAYQFQQQQRLPAHSWDVKINHLYTEQGYFKL